MNGNSSSSNAQNILAIVNCHLEGEPMRAVTRVRQLQKSLHELSTKFSHHNVIVAGDMNSQLGKSASSTYLQMGCCPSKGVDILEWGRRVNDVQEGNSVLADIPPHPYNFHSAYPMQLLAEDPLEYITFVNRPGYFTVGLDQIWYHADNHHDDHQGNASSSPEMRVAGLKHPFHSPEHRRQVIESGLPSQYHPSDHLPVGCILEWTWTEEGNDSSNNNSGSGSRDLCHPPQKKPTINMKGMVEDDLVQQAAEFLNTCPFKTAEERLEFEYIASPVPGLIHNSKPTEDQLHELHHRRERKKKLMESVSDEAKQIMDQILKLLKEVSKLKSIALAKDN